LVVRAKGRVGRKFAARVAVFGGTTALHRSWLATKGELDRLEAAKSSKRTISSVLFRTLARCWLPCIMTTVSYTRWAETFRSRGEVWRSGSNRATKCSAWRTSTAASEKAVVEERVIAIKPAGIDHTHAAAIPLAGQTAGQGLLRQGQLKAGQKVLVHGGSGGVSHYAVQFARARRALGC
jgi:hypothetical protein